MRSGMDPINRQEEPRFGHPTFSCHYSCFYCSRTVTAIMAFTLAGIRTVHERPAFTNSGVILHVHGEATPPLKHTSVWVTSKTTGKSKFLCITSTRNIISQ
jgi:hypothetical protein